jgi:hypothetical protein
VRRVTAHFAIGLGVAGAPACSMDCDTESQDEWVERASMPSGQRQNPIASTKDEAQLNCVALPPPLDYEVAWRPVKGQDERQRTAPLPTLHATGRSVVDLGEKNGGRHLGLDFYDLLQKCNQEVTTEL